MEQKEFNEAEDSRLEEESQTPPEGKEGSAPELTYIIIALCTAICIFLNLKDPPQKQAITNFLIPNSIAVWNGAYWGLLTTAFVHRAFWHLLFNMMCLKSFGSVLEKRLGGGRYLLLIICSAIVGSGAQLAFSNQTGIGFSGVIYALFGYLVAARNVEPAFKRIVDGRTIAWLLGWLVCCVFLTMSK